VADERMFADVIDRLGADAALRVAMLSLERSSDSVYWFDTTARVVYANEAACRSLGYAIEELVGLQVTAINPTYPANATSWAEAIAADVDDGRMAIPPWLRALAAGSSSQTYETVHRRKDGRLLSVEVTAAPIEAGGCRYIVAAAKDVSSRRWMESALRNVARELDRFFEVTLEMLCITDQRGAFRRVSPGWERALGFTATELMARPLFDLVHLDDRGATLDAFRQLGSQAAVVSFANRFQKKAGGYCWLQWRCVADGEKIYAAVRDVTARMGTEEPQAASRDAAHAIAPATSPAVPAGASDSPPRLAAREAAGVRVLVVEDNRLNQRVARQMLEHMGLIVETAGDGREAVDAMRQGPDRFDAILMDMQMPEMDGPQATRVIRKEFPKHAVPIIAATASADGSDMTACLDAGMNDYVSKPVEPRQLERVLSRWVALPSRPTRSRAEPNAEAGARAPVLDVSTESTPLRGVDVGAALVRLNGQHDLLVRLLRVFAQEHGKTTSDIAGAIAREDFDGALRVVHNLKGVAGTLSATAVFEAARALESGLREGPHALLPALLDRLGEALDIVCRSVSEWNGSARYDSPDETRHEPDRPVAAALLAELDTLLKNRRFSARPRFEQLKVQLTLPELAPAIDQVQRSLDRLEFEQARELLPAIATALGVPFTRG
jgi:PAS domain S-box-containing protein